MGSVRDQKLIDSALRKALAGRRRGEALCPDDNRIAAYLENRLAAAESSALEEHASACARCQELLALAVALEADAPLAAAAAARPAERTNRSVFLRFSIPLPALAVVIAAVGLSVVLLLQWRHPPETPRQAAQLEAPKNKDAPSRDIAASPPGADRLRASAPGGPARSEKPTSPAERRAKVESSSIVAPSKPPRAADERRRNAFPAAESEEKSAAAPAAPPVSEPASASGFRESALEAAGIAGGAPPRPSLSPRDAVAMLAAAEAQETSAAMPLGKEQDAVAAQGTRQDTRQQKGGAGGRAATVQQAQQAQQARGRTLADVPAIQNVSARPTTTPLRERTVGDRVFVWFRGYWIDRECLRTPDAEIVELEKDSAADAEIRKALRPGAGGAADAVTPLPLPAIVRLDDRSYVVR